jgi:hypothetical protein
MELVTLDVIHGWVVHTKVWSPYTLSVRTLGRCFGHLVDVSDIWTMFWTFCWYFGHLVEGWFGHFGRRRKCWRESKFHDANNRSDESFFFLEVEKASMGHERFLFEGRKLETSAYEHTTIKTFVHYLCKMRRWKRAGAASGKLHSLPTAVQKLHIHT